MDDGYTESGEWASHWTSAEWREFLGLPARDADEEIRSSTHAGRPLGSNDFVQLLERQMGRRLSARKGGRPKAKAELAATPG